MAVCSCGEHPHASWCACWDAPSMKPLRDTETIRRKRQSIAPTYDHRETGDRFTVETRINGRRLSEITTRDPFVHHRVVIGWRDLIGFVLGGREVTVLVGGDPAIVDDVMELDADCLTFNSTRRDEWDGKVEEALRNV